MVCQVQLVSVYINIQKGKRRVIRFCQTSKICQANDPKHKVRKALYNLQTAILMRTWGIM